MNRELFFDSLKNQSPEINQESNSDSLHQSEEADVNNVVESSETEYERQQWNVTNATKISWNKSIQENDELSNFFVAYAPMSKFIKKIVLLPLGTL